MSRLTSILGLVSIVHVVSHRASGVGNQQLGVCDLRFDKNRIIIHVLLKIQLLFGPLF